jgi:hypothetical protein
LVAKQGSESEELLGGNNRQPSADAVATKVLVRGEAVAAPAGRADDFVWPRRGVAPIGSDPVVATSDLPMTPMVAERNGTASTTGAAPPSRQVAVAAGLLVKPTVLRRGAPRPLASADPQSMFRPDSRRQAGPGLFNFQSLFGGRW